MRASWRNFESDFKVHSDRLAIRFKALDDVITFSHRRAVQEFIRAGPKVFRPGAAEKGEISTTDPCMKVSSKVDMRNSRPI